MNLLLAFTISLLLAESFGLESVPQPFKSNMVVKYLNKTLDSFLANICGKNITIPEANLGEEVGRFYNVQGSISSNFTKAIDGYKGFGFSLDVNITKVAVTGKYDLVHLDVPGLFPFFGKGPFSVTADVINVNMLINPEKNSIEDKFDFNIHYFNIVVKNSTVNFENLMNDPYVADFLNELISNLIPDLVTALTQWLLEIGKPFIDYFGNGFINCIKTDFLTNTVDECIKEFLNGKEETLISELSQRFRKELLNRIRV